MSADPEITNATIATRRDGTTGNFLTGIRAGVDPAVYIQAPEGPRRQQSIYVRLGLGILASDWIDVVGDSGSVRTGMVSFVDDVEGDEGYTALLVQGGLVPA